MNSQKLKQNPNSRDKEINVLKKLGLIDTEIAYLIWLKHKEGRRLKLRLNNRW